MWNPFKTANPAPTTKSLREQLEDLDEEIAFVSARIESLGLALRNDGSVIIQDAPPVNNISDAIEFIHTRVDLLNAVVDTLEDKLGWPL